MGRVSVIIPGRCEQYFQKTIESVLESASGDVEVVAVVDGEQNEPVECSDKRVKIIKLEESIGQRAAYNLGVRESTGEYVMKIDAHAKLCKGFDEILKSHCDDRTTVIPEMRRLNVHEWEPKPTGRTHYMYFGLDCYCYYWQDYRKRPEAQTEYPEVMTGQGSCWFTTRKWNDHIGLLDEGVGSWGNVGIEVSLRTWLCGGTQIVNKNAWQAHWFRAKEGGFPYPMNGRKVAHAHKYTFNNYYFKDDAFKNQVRPFKWLIEKFAPVNQWEAYMTDGYEAPRVIVFYTDNKLDPKLAKQVRKQIKKCAGPIPIISVSQQPIRHFGKNICVGDKPQTYQSAYEQMLAGLKAAPEGSIIYLCEHDVFYHPSHFAFLPKDKDHAYFNINKYHYALGMTSFLKASGRTSQSQCVAYRELLIKHCEDRLEAWKEGPTRLDIPWYSFESSRPNVDIRHGENLTMDKGSRLKWLQGKKRGIKNLPGWGGPSHFESKVGYKTPVEHITKPQLTQKIDVIASNNGNAAEYLRKKWKRWLPQVSPVRVPKFTRERLAAVFAQLGYQKGAEVGVKKGKFSEVLCKANPNMSLLSIDPWMEYDENGNPKLSQKKAEQIYKQARKRLKKYNAELIRNTSMDAARDIPHESLDFVYIDANHTFNFIMQDLIEWEKRVRKGGIVSGHDYFRFRNAGVVDAVDAYTRAHDIREWWVTDEKEATFFWVK